MMGTYRKVLVAVDFSRESEVVAQRGTALAREGGATLSLMHVVTPVYQEPLYDGVLSLPLDLETQLLQAADGSLRALAQRLGVPDVECIVQVGSAKTAIVQTARDRSMDLIVVGSHGVHGLGLLLGSTANAILHAAPCDVLAVRVPG